MKQEYIDRIIKAGDALNRIDHTTPQQEIDRIKDEIFCSFLDIYHYYKNNHYGPEVDNRPVWDWDC